ncbi:MAG: prephenate dehydratase domain-containing protein, partial [Pseudonocardiales bacterium]
PLIIAEETYLHVAFELMARPGTALADIDTVATHPHAEAQVRRWLLSNLAQARVALVGSTAGAAQAVAVGEYAAAVGAAVAGELYGLDVIAHDIADNAGAVTRFVLLTRPAPPAPPTGNDRTTLVAYLPAGGHHAGALLEILTEFASRGINLTRIESRPTKGGIGQYCFSIDCEGHIDDERVGDAIAALHRICGDVRYLGSYPRRDGVQGQAPTGRTDADFVGAREWLRQVRRTGQS